MGETYIPVYTGGVLGENKGVLPYEGSLCDSRKEAIKESKKVQRELPVFFDHVKILKEGEGLYTVETSIGFELISGPDFDKAE